MHELRRKGCEIRTQELILCAKTVTSFDCEVLIRSLDRPKRHGMMVEMLNYLSY